MAFTNHVFISYSHPDNLSVSGKGFVSRLEEALLPYLSNRLKRTPPKIWRDQRLSDNVDFDPVIIDSLKGSAVLLAVLTDNHVGYAWCRRKAATFCDAAEAGIGLSSGDKARLFKVVMLPPSALDGLPDAMLRQGRGTPFFTRVGKDRRISQDERDTPMPLDPSYGADYESQFNLAVSLLAAEIADSLKALGNEAAGTPLHRPEKGLRLPGPVRRRPPRRPRGAAQRVAAVRLPGAARPRTAEIRHRTARRGGRHAGALGAGDPPAGQRPGPGAFGRAGGLRPGDPERTGAAACPGGTAAPAGVAAARHRVPARTAPEVPGRVADRRGRARPSRTDRR